MPAVKKSAAKNNKPARNQAFNNRLPLYDRYFSGRYDRIVALAQAGKPFSAIAKRHKMSRARVQQIVARRMEFEKMPAWRRDLLKLSSQSAKILVATLPVPVTRARVRKLGDEANLQKVLPGVGAKMAAEIHQWARPPSDG